MKSVEFMGMPKAGKSTQLELIETLLKHQNKRNVRTIYGGGKFSPLDKKDRFLYNAWSFHEMIDSVMELRLHDIDYLLIERGVYDNIAFAHALHKSGHIKKEQYEAQARYFMEFNSLEDLVLIFMVEPSESLKREHKYHKFKGRVMNKKFLSCLYEAYQEISITHEDYLIIDGNEPLEENTEKILDFIDYNPKKKKGGILK